MKLLAVTLAITLVACFADPQQQQQQQQQSSISNHDDTQSENNIAFDLPDLTTTIELEEGGEFQIEAYKSINNDRIQMTANMEQTPHQTSTSHSQLLWVSVGQPMFIKTPASLSKRPGGQPNSTALPSIRLFHFSTDGFYTYVQMLTPIQRRFLAATANSKYHGVNVTEAQVVNLILSKFECSLVLHDEVGSKFLITGKVTDFRNFPLRVDFQAPHGSIEKKLFVNHVSDGDDDDSYDLQFTCEMASRGKLMRTNTLTISQHQLQQINIMDKLFGPTTTSSRSENGEVGATQRGSVYVTRDQLTELATEMYSTLNIVEDYQMPELQFSEAFVDGLLTQVATNHFTFVPISEALKTISSYRFDFDEDLQPDKIQRDIGSILKIDQHGEKSRIIVNETSYNESQDSSHRGGSVKVAVQAKVFGVSASTSWANDNSQRSVEELKSLNDQLRELNLLSQHDVKWEIEGNRVIPKSLNVARIGRSQFSQTLTFRRVRLQTFNAAFNRQFGLYTRRMVQLPLTPKIIDRMTALVAKVADDLSRSNAELSRQFSQFIQEFPGRVMAVVRPFSVAQQQTVDASIGQLRGQLGAVAARPAGLRRCRICFMSGGEGGWQCQGSLNSCSGWSDNPSWTARFYDDTDLRSRGCSYYWKAECELW